MACQIDSVTNNDCKVQVITATILLAKSLFEVVFYFFSVQISTWMLKVYKCIDAKYKFKIRDKKRDKYKCDFIKALAPLWKVPIKSLANSCLKGTL